MRNALCPWSASTASPGQVIQVNDVFSRYALTQPTLLLFVDEVAGTGQIRGYAVMKDVVTNSGSFVMMQESTSNVF